MKDHAEIAEKEEMERLTSQDLPLGRCHLSIGGFHNIKFRSHLEKDATRSSSAEEGSEMPSASHWVPDEEEVSAEYQMPTIKERFKEIFKLLFLFKFFFF